jgi:hypothetical protein
MCACIHTYIHTYISQMNIITIFKRFVVLSYLTFKGRGFGLGWMDGEKIWERTKCRRTLKRQSVVGSTAVCWLFKTRWAR